MSLRVSGPPRLDARPRDDIPAFHPAVRSRAAAPYTGVPPVSLLGGPPQRSPFVKQDFTIRQALDEWTSLTPLQRRAAFHFVPEELRDEQLNCWIKSSAPGKYYSVSYLGLNKPINYTDFDGVTRIVKIPSITVNQAGLERIMKIRERRGEPRIREGDEGDFVWCHFRDLEEKRQAALARQQAPEEPPRMSASYDSRAIG